MGLNWGMGGWTNRKTTSCLFLNSEKLLGIFSLKVQKLFFKQNILNQKFSSYLPS